MISELSPCTLESPSRISCLSLRKRKTVIKILKCNSYRKLWHAGSLENEKSVKIGRDVAKSNFHFLSAHTSRSKEKKNEIMVNICSRHERKRASLA